MKIALFAMLALITSPVLAQNMTDVMASIHGTCTHDTCPPGTKVSVDAKEGDTGIATTPDGSRYDLINLKNIRFTVVQDTDNGYPEREATVSTDHGDLYYIEWMFLKKK